MNPLAWLTAGTSIVDKLLDFIPDPAAKAAALQSYQMAMLEFAKTEEASQATVEANEAASADPFTSRARPFIIWVCGIALAYTFVLAPFANPLLHLYFPKYVPVVLDSGTLMSLVTALLGIGGMHVFENVQAGKVAAASTGKKQ